MEFVIGQLVEQVGGPAPAVQFGTVYGFSPDGQELHVVGRAHAGMNQVGPWRLWIRPVNHWQPISDTSLRLWSERGFDTDPRPIDLGHALKAERDFREEAERLRTEQAREHDRFRHQVRDLAIEKAKELRWCTPGLNDALDQLGLDPKVERFEARVRVTAYQYVTVVVEADDEDEARSMALNDEGDCVTEEIDHDDWHVDVDDVEWVREYTD